jgi:hypothetical protein
MTPKKAAPNKEIKKKAILDLIEKKGDDKSNDSYGEENKSEKSAKYMETSAGNIKTN